MWNALYCLHDRLVHLRSRADELRELRQRLDAQPSPRRAGELETRAARELLGHKLALASALASVQSCGRCARGHPLPFGRWAGGQCCGGPTAGIFTDDELAALRLSGTTPARLTAPVADHAGCVFRGPDGCSLALPDRPNLCVRYVCRELEDELRARGDWASAVPLMSALRRAFAGFAQLREARLGDT